jgi:transposase-like protein
MAWLSCLTDLKNRGLNHIFIVCVGGRTGFAEAIRAAYPQTEVQLCIARRVRAALRYVTDKDSKPVAADLRKVYRPATVEEAEEAPERFAEVWGARYPTVVRQWRLRWNDIITRFDFPPPIRKAISTANAIESANGVIRKFAQSRAVSERRVGAEIGVPGDPRSVEALGDGDCGLGGGAEPLAIVFENRLPRSGQAV